MSLYDIRKEIEELEDKLSADPENSQIKRRLHLLTVSEHHAEEYFEGIL